MQAPSAPLLGGTIPFMGVHSQREKEEREDANEEEPTVAATFLQPDLDEEVTAGGGMELRQRRVYVHTLEGQVVPVDISEGEKVEDLKMRLDDHDPFLSANAPAFGDRHLYDQDGEELREGRRVLSYSIGESSSIRLLLARYPTYADWLQKKTHVPKILWVILCGMVGSLLIAACSQVSFYLPWNDTVPVSGQTFAVLLIPALLGFQLGVLATILYAIEGACGLPFFATQKGGLGVLLGATGGYVVGFIFAAALVGWLVEKRGWDRRLSTALLAMLLGNITIYLVAIPFLSHFVGWSKVWDAGLVPFLPGDAIKVVVATLLLPLGWMVRAHRFNVKHSSSPPVTWWAYLHCSLW